jgi:hypothetical protein
LNLSFGCATRGSVLDVNDGYEKSQQEMTTGPRDELQWWQGRSLPVSSLPQI